jgi:hypothetical protein
LPLQNHSLQPVLGHNAVYLQYLCDNATNLVQCRDLYKPITAIQREPREDHRSVEPREQALSSKPQRNRNASHATHYHPEKSAHSPKTHNVRPRERQDGTQVRRQGSVLTFNPNKANARDASPNMAHSLQNENKAKPPVYVASTRQKGSPGCSRSSWIAPIEPTPTRIAEQLCRRKPRQAIQTTGPVPDVLSMPSHPVATVTGNISRISAAKHLLRKDEYDQIQQSGSDGAREPNPNKPASPNGALNLPIT